MRIMSIDAIVTEWTDEIAGMFCIDGELPNSVRKKCWFSASEGLRSVGPLEARRRIWRAISMWVDRDQQLGWYDLVKQPAPAFLATPITEGEK